MHAGLHPSIHLESDRNRFGNPLDSNKIRKALISSITNEAVEELGLKKGIQAYAVIKASDVMIAIK
jgi:ABC-type molybdate transport system ATPase subunit